MTQLTRKKSIQHPLDMQVRFGLVVFLSVDKIAINCWIWSRSAEREEQGRTHESVPEGETKPPLLVVGCCLVSRTDSFIHRWLQTFKAPKVSFGLQELKKLVERYPSHMKILRNRTPSFLL